MYTCETMQECQERCIFLGVSFSFSFFLQCPCNWFVFLFFSFSFFFFFRVSFEWVICRIRYALFRIRVVSCLVVSFFLLPPTDQNIRPYIRTRKPGRGRGEKRESRLLENRPFLHGNINFWSIDFWLIRTSPCSPDPGEIIGKISKQQGFTRSIRVPGISFTFREYSKFREIFTTWRGILST